MTTTLTQNQVLSLAVLIKYLRTEGDSHDKAGNYAKSERYFDLADSIDLAVFAMSQGEATPKQIALVNRNLPFENKPF